MDKIEIKRILIPVDFSKTSDAATSTAMVLAQLLKAEVFIIYVIEDNWSDFPITIDSKSMPYSIPNIEKAVELKLKEKQEQITKDFGITPDVFITPGHIHTEIIKYSEEKKMNLIVMGSHGLSGYDEFFIGSNAQRVVTLSEVPVMTMQKKCHKSGFKNILIPIDNALHSREKVNVAVLIASLFGSQIHILGLPNSSETEEVNKFKIKIESVEKIVTSGNLNYKTTLLFGDNIAMTAMDYAKEHKCDLIVINTGHESKINDIFLGAFAQQIVNHSKIPVLSFKHTKTHYSISAAGFPGN